MAPITKSDILAARRIFGHIVRLENDVPAHNTWLSAGTLICLSVVLLVASGNDPALVGSIKFGATRTPHQWNSGGMPYDVVMMLERRNGPRRLRDHDDDGDDDEDDKNRHNNAKIY